MAHVFFKVEVGGRQTDIWPPRLVTNFPGPVLVMDEGVDEASPLGTVHWSVELRGGTSIFCSTFVEARASLEARLHGVSGFLPPGQDDILVTLETVSRPGDPVDW